MSESEDEDEQQPLGRSESMVPSDPIAHGAGRQVEIGTETKVEQLLDKYVILQCAKLHLSVTDASSGSYIPNLP